MTKKIDLLGQKFGRLTVVSEAPKKNGRIRWNCVCDCGNRTVVMAYSLRNGHTQSCGCFNIERTVETSKKHGQRNSRLYRIWQAMKNRCNWEKGVAFSRYGGRGVRVCEAWLDFPSFSSWALSNGYKDDLTLDRINVDGDYSPENCRWATIKEQNRNTRANIFFKGKCLAEWCEELGLRYGSVHARLSRGWSIERALSEPIKN